MPNEVQSVLICFFVYNTLQYSPSNPTSLHLPLNLTLHRFTPQPQGHKRHPSSNRDTDARDPRPRTTDSPTPRPFVVREMADCDCVFLFQVGEEGPFVVDFKIEDAVLVGQFEGGCVDG